MISQPTIDPTRLVVIAGIRDAAMGAAKKAEDALNNLRKEAKRLSDEIRAIETGAINFAGLRPMETPQVSKADVTSRLAQLRAKRAKLDRPIAEASALRDATAERAASAGQLSRRCHEFVGGQG